MQFFGSKNIKDYVRGYLERNRSEYQGLTVMDIPAGSGYSTRVLQAIGAVPRPYDLFPEFFQCEGIQCQPADLNKALPIHDAAADVVLCQEGIEHMQDQLHVLLEFNRILKPGGRLLLTTPNYSSLRSRLGFFLNEAESYKFLPPNPIESVWFGEGAKSGDRFYFGHMFLIGIQRLKLLSTVAGFRIHHIHHTRVNITSLVLLLLCYPLILISSFSAYFNAQRKNPFVDAPTRKKLFRESLRLMLDPRILVDRHLFVEFEKDCEIDEINDRVSLYHKYTRPDFQT